MIPENYFFVKRACFAGYVDSNLPRLISDYFCPCLSAVLIVLKVLAVLLLLFAA